MSIDRGCNYAQAKIDAGLAAELLADAIQVERGNSAKDRELLKSLNMLLEANDKG